MGLVQISTADSSTKPSGLPAFGLSWHVCSFGLDQPMKDLGILFLKPYMSQKRIKDVWYSTMPVLKALGQ